MAVGAIRIEAATEATTANFMKIGVAGIGTAAGMVVLLSSLTPSDSFGQRQILSPTQDTRSNMDGACPLQDVIRYGLMNTSTGRTISTSLCLDTGDGNVTDMNYTPRAQVRGCSFRF